MLAVVVAGTSAGAEASQPIEARCARPGVPESASVHAGAPAVDASAGVAWIAGAPGIRETSSRLPAPRRTGTHNVLKKQAIRSSALVARYLRPRAGLPCSGRPGDGERATIACPRIDPRPAPAPHPGPGIVITNDESARFRGVFAG